MTATLDRSPASLRTPVISDAEPAVRTSASARSDAAGVSAHRSDVALASRQPGAGTAGRVATTTGDNAATVASDSMTTVGSIVSDCADLDTRLVVLIPAYQPDERLVEITRSVHQQLSCELLVVDDGSGADCSAIFEAARRSGARVLRYATNAGKGYALRYGLAHTAEHWPLADVVCADADGQHRPADIAAVAERMRESGHMTLGIREFTGPVPLRSRVGNDATALLFRLGTGWKLRDTQTGLRGYPAGNYEWLLNLPGDRYEYELSTLLAAVERNEKVEEVSIATVYEPGNTSSHFRPLQDSARIYAPLLKFSGASFASFLIDWLVLMVTFDLSGRLLASVVVARLVSGSANFLMNRSVFRKHGKLGASAVKYLAVALGIMAASYLGLAALTHAGFSLALAKPLVDVALYVASYSLQKRVVFR